MSLSKDAISKLRSVKDAILAEPELYDQDTAPMSGHTCNTPSCIFGWLAWMYGPDADRSFGEYSMGEMADMASLDRSQFNLLYHCHQDWPEPFKGLYEKNRTKAGRAKVAAARIEHFIATDGKE